MNRIKSLETILVLVLALLISYWIFKVNYLLPAAGILVITGLFSPFLTNKIHWLWMKLADASGFVMNRVILTLIFFIIVWPLAILSRMFRKDPLQLKRKQDSYFKERNFTYTKEDLENVW